MTEPFDIEEMFPGDGAGPVRLPRRQSGNAPQGMVVTLLADYSLRTGASLPSAAIVALLGESGISEAGARTAISRLARRGVLEVSRNGRNSSYRLSSAVAAYLSAGGRWIISSTAATEPWDGWWTLVAFSLPQAEDTQRRALRGQLRWWGFAPLYDGLWVSPGEVTAEAAVDLAKTNAGGVTVFRARHVELAASVGRDPIAAWDLGAISAQYESFVRRWKPMLPKVRSGRVRGGEAVRARTEVMDTYRRFPTLDPLLPLELLPPNWLRRPVREVFVAIYDGLAEPAQEHVRAVVTRVVGEPRPGIQAHTTVDMLGGVREDSGPESSR